MAQGRHYEFDMFAYIAQPSQCIASHTIEAETPLCNLCYLSVGDS